MIIIYQINIYYFLRDFTKWRNQCGFFYAEIVDEMGYNLMDFSINCV